MVIKLIDINKSLWGDGGAGWSTADVSAARKCCLVEREAKFLWGHIRGSEPLLSEKIWTFQRGRLSEGRAYARDRDGFA